MSKVNKDLKKYIEENIFPLYSRNDLGHNMSHINYVINRSLKFASSVDGIDLDMVYTVASYHDVGHHIDPDNHEKVSAAILKNDDNLKRFFSDEQILIMSDAVYDHRASLEGEPRSIYGKIVSSADRNTLIELPLRRTYTYRITNAPSMSLEELVSESKWHISKKFGNKGYASTKMYFEDLDYKKFLEDIGALLDDDDKFREMYFRINGINDVESNMLFLFDEIRSHHKELSLDKVLYFVYIKLNTDMPFYEVKKKILDARGIDEYSFYTSCVDEKLVRYVEDNIFPKYQMNDKAHGIVHIREVIRRCFALAKTFNLDLNPNMIYAMAACHDLNKYVDSDIHEKLAAQAFLKDEFMNAFFDSDDVKTISEAIEDHRSGLESKPRSIYGMLVSSADRNTSIEMVFIRSFFVALGEGKNSNRDTKISDYLEYTLNRLRKRYSVEDPENMFMEDEIYDMFLQDMRVLLSNPEKFNTYYCSVNGIDDVNKLVCDYSGYGEGEQEKVLTINPVNK